jgi:YidC/Oxa1 family membrane protein insertase
MDKRTITAVALSLAVLILWSYFMPERKAPRQVPVVEKKVPVQERAQKLAPERTLPAPQEKQDFTVKTYSSTGDVVVETDLYKAIFSTQGAIIKYWELTTHRDKDLPVVLLKEPGMMPPLGILFESPDRNLPQRLVYKTSAKKIVLTEGGMDKEELLFTYSDGNMQISKKLTFYNDKYKVDVSVETSNTPSYLLPVGTGFGVFDKNQREHKGPVLLVNNDRKEFDEGLKQSEFFTGNVSWIAQEDKYFTAAIVPVTQTDGAEVWKEGSSAEIAFKIKSAKNDFILYVGPKEYDRLKAFGVGLDHMIDFGWFAFVAMPLFWVLKFFYKYLGNYGWSIVILTILVRVPFIPILNKSQQSMKKMQKVQPLIAELKEKYKNDSAKMQKEMMGLYKKHKVNPIGGCLPMFLQIPVFIALYNVLLKAIELRGAPFAFWITDLAVKDPYYVMPVVMGATMVLQQKMTPTAMDPKQAKMMMLMPIVFTFMFLTFPAGLVLYWLVNNVLGIVQQYYVNKKP